MSRRTHKTVNLTTELVDRIDRIVAEGKTTTAVSRDDFVRQAIGLLFLATAESRPPPLTLVIQQAKRLRPSKPGA